MALYIDLFDIQLVSGSAELRPGESVVGSVLIRTKSDAVMFKSLRVDFTGESRTAWIAKRSDKIFETREVYLGHSIDLPCKDLARPQCAFYSVPFSYTLPCNLPPSFEGEFGFIRYSCIATLQYGNSKQSSCLLGQQSSELMSEKLLTIVNANDALFKYKVENNALMSVEDQFEAVGCFGRTGKIEVKLSISQSHFAVGETLIAEVIVRNKTRQKLQDVVLAIVQESRFQALSVYEAISGSKDTLRLVDSANFSKIIDPFSDVKWNAMISVPPVSPTFETRLVCVKYFLRLSAGAAELRIPIVIAWHRAAHKKLTASYSDSKPHLQNGSTPCQQHATIHAAPSSAV